jgi:hypothetical protein
LECLVFPLLPSLWIVTLFHTRLCFGRVMRCTRTCSRLNSISSQCAPAAYYQQIRAMNYQPHGNIGSLTAGLGWSLEAPKHPVDLLRKGPSERHSAVALAISTSPSSPTSPKSSPAAPLPASSCTSPRPFCARWRDLATSAAAFFLRFASAAFCRCIRRSETRVDLAILLSYLMLCWDELAIHHTQRSQAPTF